MAGLYECCAILTFRNKPNKAVPTQYWFRLNQNNREVTMGMSRAVKLSGGRIFLDRCVFFDTKTRQPDWPDLKDIQQVELTRDIGTVGLAAVQFLSGNRAVGYQIDALGNATPMGAPDRPAVTI